MKRAALLLLLLALAARAEEDPEASKLPACLREGGQGSFIRDADTETPRLTAEYGVNPTQSGTVSDVHLSEESGDLGPLTLKRETRALVELATGRIALCSGAMTHDPKAGPRLNFKLEPDPEKEGRLLLTRYEYDEKGEAKERVSKLAAPAGLWTPDLLEPFVAAQLNPAPGESTEIAIFDTTRLRFSRSTVVYRRLGEGKRKVGEDDVPCSIWRRERGDAKALVYRRIEDGMPLRDEAARLTIRPPEPEEKKEGR